MELQTQISAFLNSTCWRATVPLRWLKQRLPTKTSWRSQGATNQEETLSLLSKPIPEQQRVRDEIERRHTGSNGLQIRLDPPVSFNERILHRIIYDRDPRLKIICDKLAVRDYIEKHAGSEFVVPILGVWKDPTEIAWDSLPQRFVLKPNHSSGPVALVRGIADKNPDLLIAKATEWLSYDYFDVSFEWGYQGIPRRLIAEPFLAGPDGSPPAEAQVLTFNGKAAVIRVLTGEKLSPDRRDNWFDVSGTRLPICTDDTPGDFNLSREDIHLIIPVAEAVSDGFSHLRVDFYLTDTGPKIGELTPYHNAGSEMWSPPEWNEKLGRLWDAA